MRKRCTACSCRSFVQIFSSTGIRFPSRSTYIYSWFIELSMCWEHLKTKLSNNDMKFEGINHRYEPPVVLANHREGRGEITLYGQRHACDRIQTSRVTPCACCVVCVRIARNIVDSFEKPRSATAQSRFGDNSKNSVGKFNKVDWTLMLYFVCRVFNWFLF